MFPTTSPAHFAKAKLRPPVIQVHGETFFLKNFHIHHAPTPVAINFV